MFIGLEINSGLQQPGAAARRSGGVVLDPLSDKTAECWHHEGGYSVNATIKSSPSARLSSWACFFSASMRRFCSQQTWDWHLWGLRSSYHSGALRNSLTYPAGAAACVRLGAHFR